MHIRIFVLFLVISCYTTVSGQFTDSNLPIIMIQTEGGITIPDQPRIGATMKVIYRGEGQRNFVADENDATKLNYRGKIRIEVRGSSSQNLPKKQYGLTTVKDDNRTNNNVSLLGMPEENDWVLNGLAFDASLIRDYLSYNLSRQLGNYAPRQRYCEVLINGDYKGLYILQEKVKIDDNRVDISKIGSTDIAGKEITGGYLTKADKVSVDDPSAWTMPTYAGTVADFIHEFPKPSDITPGQHAYIKSVFDKLAATANNNSIASGYPSVIDVPSFIDFMLVNELAANVDAYQFSTFFHKDKNAKLRAGPLWDLNLTFGNDLYFWGLDRSKTNTWQFDNGDNVGPRFWRDLYNNSTFKCYMSRRWNEITKAGEPLSEASINSFIDETLLLIGEAVVRENQRWGTIGNHHNQIEAIRRFVAARVHWMNGHLASFNPCSNVVTAPLVITRIHYHPSTTAQFTNDDDQEFIEITNNSDQPVPVTGFYFRETGFVYQFPTDGVLPPRAVIQLANDRKTFRQRYGYEPYGEFTRNLSNKTENLVLADAFGNVIDQVNYIDSPPWPNADGNGMHLKLNDLSADNADAVNWTAIDEPVFSTELIVAATEDTQAGITVHPSPTRGTLSVNSLVQIEDIEVHDTRGTHVTSVTVRDLSTTLDLSTLPSGIYILNILTGNGYVIRKVVKY